jgi:enoyl-CoA hydratase/carnithine racemase
MLELNLQDRIHIALDASGVAAVSLARPDKMNALDDAMFGAITEALAQLRAMAGLRAVVLHGQGRAFCAGLDKSSFVGMAAAAADPLTADFSTRTHGMANRPQHIALGWRELPVPVIAAVHGVAFGGGLQIALGADVRLVAPATQLSVMEIKWGIVPDMAGFVLTQKLLRDDVLRELTLTGRVVQAEEAVRVGLATRLCDDPLAEAHALAQQIAAHSPAAVQAAKRLLNQAAGITGVGDLASASAAALLLAESAEQSALMGQPQQQEAVRANFEKRKPRF